MKKNLPIIIVGIIIVLGIAGFIYQSSNKKDQVKEKVLGEEESIEKPTSTQEVLIPPTGAMNDTKNTQITELKIEDLKVGTGSAVKSGDTVVMHYKGTLLDGTKFDSSYDHGTPFETQIGVGRVIKGWDEGVPGMKVGGKRRLTIPSDLAYGERGAGGSIPPNSPLIFEVELLEIK